MSLPQSSTVHLRGQTADLRRRAFTGFVGQLDGQEIRLMIGKEMWEKSVNIRQHWEQRCINKTDVSRQTLSRSLWQRWGLVFSFLKKKHAPRLLWIILFICALYLPNTVILFLSTPLCINSYLFHTVGSDQSCPLFFFFDDYVHFLCFPCLNWGPKIEFAISITSPWGKFVI